MSTIELIGVPFDGYGRPGNQSRAAAALRDAGIEAAFAGHRITRSPDIDLPEPVTQRAAGSGLVNEPALLAMTEDLSGRIQTAVVEGRFPFLYGGDCTVLLGTITGLRDQLGDVGLLFIDQHEDTMPLDVSEDGEAANMEIGLLLGLTGTMAPEPLRRRLPALRAEGLALVGQRDERWRRQFNVGSLRDRGVWSRRLDEVANDPAAAAAGRAAVAHVRQTTDRWWLHVDLDVLDPEEFFAQGVPGVEDEPGGLTWSQLTELVAAALASGGCLGWSVVIYDPDQDPDGSDAARIVQFVRDVSAHLT